MHSGGRKNDLAILGENARVLADSSSGVVVSQSGRLISLIGVTDIIVVDTPDALLVTTSEHAQRVKSVVDALKLSGRSDVL
jgi:mannose-1-phosphate guanylyltransferase